MKGRKGKRRKRSAVVLTNWMGGQMRNRRMKTRKRPTVVLTVTKYNCTNGEYPARYTDLDIHIPSSQFCNVQIMSSWLALAHLDDTWQYKHNVVPN